MSFGRTKHNLNIKIQHSAQTRVNISIVLDVMQWIFACSLRMQISLHNIQNFIYTCPHKLTNTNILWILPAHLHQLLVAPENLSVPFPCPGLLGFTIDIIGVFWHYINTLEVPLEIEVDVAFEVRYYASNVYFFQF